MLTDCADRGNHGICDWYQMPAKPGTEEAAEERAANRAASERRVSAETKGAFCTPLGGNGGTLTCDRFRSRV